MSHKKTGSAFGLAIIIGAVLGYLIGLFIPDKARKKQKQELTNKSEELKRRLTDPKEREKIQAIFQENSQKATDTYRQAKKYLVTHLSELKGAVSEIDKDKYIKAVKKAIDQIKTDQQVPTKQLAVLKDYLEKDFALLKPKTKPIKKAQKATKAKK